MPSEFCKLKSRCENCQQVTDGAMSHHLLVKGFHYPKNECSQNIMIFLLHGSLLVNSEEYAGTTLHDGQFILQAIGSKLEALALEPCECIIYRFKQPLYICDRFQHIIEHTEPPLIYTPLNMVPVLTLFLEGVKHYIQDQMRCKEFLNIKHKELSYILNCYYTDRELSTLFNSISSYTSSFHYFVIQNHHKVKTVEELAHLGGYSITTFRRMFKNLFNEPAYEWMLKKKRTGILEDLRNNQLSISEISNKYGFDTLSHFSNFCKNYFGNSPRNLRLQIKAGATIMENPKKGRTKESINNLQE